MRSFIAATTRPIRHAIAKRIVPSFYCRSVNPRTRNALRPAFLFIKGSMGDGPLVGAEIGVWDGANAERILQNLNMKMLYLVDPYVPYIDSEKLLDPAPQREIAEKRLSAFADKVRFIRSGSATAVDTIPEGLDFVYIDANHQYRCVKRDIEKYYPKVRREGIIGGHDFSNSFLGVIRATSEFCASRRLQLMVEGDDWWIIKPDTHRRR